MFKNWTHLFLRCLSGPARSHWLVERLQELQRHQEAFANAAHSVVSGDGPFTLEDALCSAESMQAHLAELAEHLAAIDVMRALGHGDDPRLPARRP